MVAYTQVTAPLLTPSLPGREIPGVVPLEEGGSRARSFAARRGCGPDSSACALDRAELRRALRCCAAPRGGTEGPRLGAGAEDVPGHADAAPARAPDRRDAHRLSSARQPDPPSDGLVRRAVAVAAAHRPLAETPPPRRPSRARRGGGGGLR